MPLDGYFAWPGGVDVEAELDGPLELPAVARAFSLLAVSCGVARTVELALFAVA